MNSADMAVLASQWLNAIVPVQEINSDSNDLIFHRDSIGTNRKGQLFAPDEVRTEDVCLTSIASITLETGLKDYRVRAVKGDVMLMSQGTSLYKATHLSGALNVTKIADASKDPILSMLTGSDQDFHACAHIIDAETYIACTQNNTLGEGGSIFKTTDGGATWAHVLTFEEGFVTYWQKPGFGDDGHYVVAAYGKRYSAVTYPRFNETSTMNPRKVYISSDYGDTWEEIYEFPNEANRHVHLAVFSPSDPDHNTVYVSMGDMSKYDPSTLNYVVKLTKVGDTWQRTDMQGRLRHNPVFAFPDGKYLYWGKDSGKYGAILRHDTTDDTIETVLNCYRERSEVESPYVQNGSPSMCFGIIKHDGVFYAALRDNDEESVCSTAGIYCSVDGMNWTACYREDLVSAPRYVGFSTICGYGGGYLWGVHCDSAGDYYTFKMPPVNAAATPAIYAERGIENVAPPVWREYSTKNVDTIALSSEETFAGEQTYKCVAIDAGHQYLQIITTYVAPEDNPALNDYVLATAWIKPADTWPKEACNIDEGIIFKIVSRMGGSVESNPARVYLDKSMYKGWEQMRAWAKCTEDGFDPSYGIRCELLIETTQMAADGVDFADLTFYITKPQIIIFSDMHYSGAYQPRGTIRRDEQVEFGIRTNNNTIWTLTASWLPEIASRELHGITALPVISVAGQDGAKAEFIYNSTTQKFGLTDTNSTQWETGTSTWHHDDIFHVAIKGDGNVVIRKSLLGEAATFNLAGLSLKPVYGLLGADIARSKYGVGRFANIRSFDWLLSGDDTDVVLSSVRSLLNRRGNDF